MRAAGAAGGEAREIALTWEMTLTRDEFFRLLPAAVYFAPYRVSGNRIECVAGERTWSIVVEPMADHCIGLLRLARHRVSLRFCGYTAAEVKAFVKRFKLYFQRGGG